MDYSGSAGLQQSNGCMVQEYIFHIHVHIEWSVSCLLFQLKKCIERSESGCYTKLLNLSQIW